MNRKIFSILNIIILIITTLTIPIIANAKTLEMPLLAVQGEENNFTGSIAKLSLTIEEGNGRVFLDTSPFSKADTQISARTAQRQACNFLNFDCSKYDFFYQIKADSSIIGGPSAGAAFTVITIAALDDQEIKPGISMTGTINSGNIVGPVGGLKEKIEVAATKDIHTVLIAQGEAIQKKDNVTVDLIEFGKNNSVNVIEIAVIREAVEIFTGKKYPKTETNFSLSEDYKSTMEMLANDLCDRGEELFEEIIDITTNFTQMENNTNIIEAKNLTKRAKEAYNQSAIYSAASYCYGANVQYHSYLLKIKNFTREEFNNELEKLKEEIDRFNEQEDKKEITTITDIQTRMIVRERILDAENTIKQIEEFLELDLDPKEVESKILNISQIYNSSEENINISNNNTYVNNTNISNNKTMNKTEEEEFNQTQEPKVKIVLPTNQLAYAVERFYSAGSWAKFYDNSGSKFDFTQSNLEESCKLKLLEADERYQHVNLYFPNLLRDALQQYQQARIYHQNGQYELCLFKAAKTVATINSFVNLMYISDNEKITSMTKLKLEVAEELIATQAQKDRFPIVGYSYYEYSKSLLDTDKYTSLLYAEYALELSNLDLYFKEKKRFEPLIEMDKKSTYIFLAGFCMGMFFAFLFVIILNLRLRNKRAKRKGKRRKRVSK